MRVLVVCEFSGVVRDAFRVLGHDAWSCDFLPTEVPGPHIEGDIREMGEEFWTEGPGWDLMICHPPCTHLAVSGAKHFHKKRGPQLEALSFVEWLLERPVGKIALENPIGIISTWIRKPDQVIQPWQFGHGEVKATCLWLKGLPLLVPTEIVEGRVAKVHRMPPSPERWRERSRTLPGVAWAMAVQWGGEGGEGGESQVK